MNEMLIRRFKRQLKRGPVYGPFAKTCDSAIVEALGYAGFDFVVLDMEHGPNSVETIQNLVRAAELRGMLPMVRVPGCNEEVISKVLDVGACGVQVPQVNGPSEVEQVVRAARFAPKGMRGVCRYVRAAGYSSTPKMDYFKKANEALLVIQVEGEAAAKNLDAILDVGGFDVLFIGPYDLSQAMGVPGQVSHPRVVASMRQIVKTCLARGVAVGTFADSPESAAPWLRQGVRYMSCSVDVGIVYEAGVRMLSSFRRQVV